MENSRTLQLLEVRGRVEHQRLPESSGSKPHWQSKVLQAGVEL